MANNYPNLLRQGELRKLNDEIILKLGVPLFFAVPEPSRPQATTASGQLYEIVTSLYAIYHDYGIKMLENYISFCKKMIPGENPSITCSHLKNVSVLRGGLCHGSLPNGSRVYELTNELGFIFPNQTILWPDFMRQMTEAQCQTIVSRLSRGSDQLVQYIRNCADIIRANPLMLRAWRELLVEKVFKAPADDKDSSTSDNSVSATDDSSTSGKKPLFDGRIINDIEYVFVIAHQRREPYQDKIKEWLRSLEPMFLNGTFTNSDELNNSLFQTFDELYNPPQRSSLDVFGI